jgi:signal transduction histidine kinase
MTRAFSNEPSRRRKSPLERGQFLRVVLFGILMIALSAAATFLVGSYLIEPAFDSPPRPSTTWVAYRFSKLLDRPGELQTELSELKKRVGLEMTLYNRDGRRLATNATEVPEPLDAERVEELGRVKTWFQRGSGAVVATEKDGLVETYALFTTESPEAPWWIVLIKVFAVLGVIALVSIPLARSVTAPLERLAELTRAFGQGDLSVRARWTRRDEIGDLAAAFDEMADRLAALRKAETELLANISHELRTPLSRMRLALELFLDGDAHTAKRHVEDIGEEIQELEQLLDDVMTAARLDPSRDSASRLTQLSKKPLPARDVLDAAARRFSLRHPDRRLAAHFAPQLGEIVADGPVLQRALDNLLDNAAKYSDSASEVRLEAELSDDALRIEVVDEGIGISELDLPHVFEPFFRGDRSRARTTGGAGLGLAVARRIVLAHGGEVTFRSVIDRGTTATVVLPLIPRFDADGVTPPTRERSRPGVRAV